MGPLTCGPFCSPGVATESTLRSKITFQSVSAQVSSTRSSPATTNTTVATGRPRKVPSRVVSSMLASPSASSRSTAMPPTSSKWSQTAAAPPDTSTGRLPTNSRTKSPAPSSILGEMRALERLILPHMSRSAELGRAKRGLDSSHTHLRESALRVESSRSRSRRTWLA